MKRLGETQSRLLGYRYRDNLDLGTIANELGQAAPAVSMKLARIRRVLRQCIEERLSGETA